MSKFNEREKSFEKKFVQDEELQFKVNAKRNKYLGEWAADKLGKVDEDKKAYAQEVIKSDFAEPGDEDVIRKVMADIAEGNLKITEATIRGKLTELETVARGQLLGDIS